MTNIPETLRHMTLPELLQHIKSLPLSENSSDSTRTHPETSSFSSYDVACGVKDPLNELSQQYLAKPLIAPSVRVWFDNLAQQRLFKGAIAQ